MTRLLNEDTIFSSVVLPTVVDEFCQFTNNVNRRILFTLDGFDTNFSEFRMKTVRHYADTKDAAIRSQIEFDWLRSLLHVAIEMKSGKDSVPLGRLIDFCLTIPKDRFLEIRRFERDAIVYRNKISDIFWSGFELFLMLRKRLESLSNHKTDEAKELAFRLQEVMRAKFSEIPPVIEIDFHGQMIKIELVLYILRHTFWRPRDVLYYIGKLIAYRDELRKWGRRLSSDLVRKAISDCTWDVVNSEFINELQGYCTNVGDIVEKFRRSAQVLSYDDVYRCIGGMDFHFANRESDITDMYEKISFLYEIGFLGVLLDKDLIRVQRVATEAIFYFSDGDTTYKSLVADVLKRQRFLIHPIFCEWLSLRTEGHPLTLNYSWEYLKNNDDVLAVS